MGNGMKITAPLRAAERTAFTGYTPEWQQKSISAENSSIPKWQLNSTKTDGFVKQAQMKETPKKSEQSQEKIKDVNSEQSWFKKLCKAIHTGFVCNASITYTEAKAGF